MVLNKWDIVVFVLSEAIAFMAIGNKEFCSSCVRSGEFMVFPTHLNDGLFLACKNNCFYEKESVQKNCLKSSRTLS